MAQDRLSERLAVVATIDPDAYTTGAQNSDIIDMHLHRRVMFIVMSGDLGSSATLNFKVQGSAASNMGSPADLTGKVITALTQAGTDGDKQSIVEVTAEEVATQGFRYIRGIMTVGVATSDAGMIAIAGNTRYQPANEYDLATVDEIVA